MVLAVGALGLAAYWLYPSAPARDLRQATVAATVQAIPPPESPARPLQTAAVPVPHQSAAVLVPPQPGSVAAPPLAIPSPAASLEDVVNQVSPAVVRIETSKGSGSAFYIRSDTLLTNVHVVGDSASITVRRLDGTTTLARVERTSPLFDIAILRVSNPVPTQATIEMGFTENVRVGQEVFAIGSALGTLHNTVTRGIVSAVRQSGNATLVQTDASLNPGNSGGPLLDRSGTAIGIATMGYGGMQGLNFAVGIGHARALIEGRQAPAPVTTTTSNDRGLSVAVLSEPEQKRADGARAYDDSLTRLARLADDFDGEWRRFRERCYSGTVVGAFDREWFALFTDRSLPAPIPAYCTSYLADLKQDAANFRDQMQRADDAARRADVYPGARRDARRTRRLSHDAWER
ncbi:MAG: trypsin-like peptidase domain-containing protein [Vicinamibacterales bacterium]